MSTTQSAARIVSSSCSTTISVLPRSRSRSSVSSSRWLSRWCSRSTARPARTAPRPAPSRSGSPAGSVRLPARQRGRRPVQRQVVQADVQQETQPRVDLLEDPPGDLHVPVGQLQLRAAAWPARRSGSMQKSAMDRPSTVTASETGLSRRALAGRARHLAHEPGEAFPAGVALRLGVPAFDVGHPRPRSWCSTTVPARTGSCTGRAPGRRSRKAAPAGRGREPRPRGCRR
jgi:hypothetical protein